jgi:flavodoxin
MTIVMKALIVYDSLYGNTQKIAQAIGDTLAGQEDVVTLRVGDVSLDQFAGIKLLIIGSPTQRFQPTSAITDLLKGIPQNSLKGIKVAAFDTRLTKSNIEKTPILAFFVKLFGRAAYADKSIADRLTKKGGELIANPEGFFVEGMEGPLVQGELERAVDWARLIVSKT